MKLRVSVDGKEELLEFSPKDGAYGRKGVFEATGTASVEATLPGVYSVLLGHSSFTVRVEKQGQELEVWVGSRRYAISIADARDRAQGAGQTTAKGPQQVRAQMPGKVIQVLVRPGQAVEAGSGLIIVEAMKMQNEMKALQAGTVAAVIAVEGATVAAGEVLILIE